MASEERDSTDEWLLPAVADVPTVSELVERIDIALTVARGAEKTALESDAAAAGAVLTAERAAAAAARAETAIEALRDDPSPSPGPSDEFFEPPPPTPGPTGGGTDLRLAEFLIRAEKLNERLVRLRVNA